MKRWHILKIGATEITLHPAMLVYLLYGWLTGHFAYILMAYASIVLHEAAHASVAAMFGCPPAAMEITPLGAVMCMEDEVRLSPWKRAVMILAGPFVTLLLCGIALWAVQHGWLRAETGRIMFLANLSILLMNLVPVLPLDGGRLLLLILESVLPRQAAARTLRIISNIIGVSLILLNVYTAWQLGGWNLSLAFSGCCVLYGAAHYSTTQAMAELRWFLDRKIALERKGHLRMVWYTCQSSIPLRRLVTCLPAGRQAGFICLEAGSQRICCVLHEAELIQHYLNQPAATLGAVADSAHNWFDFAKCDTI